MLTWLSRAELEVRAAAGAVLEPALRGEILSARRAPCALPRSVEWGVLHSCDSPNHPQDKQNDKRGQNRSDCRYQEGSDAGQAVFQASDDV